MAAEYGLAEDWLEFEAEIGQRPCVEGNLTALLDGFTRFEEILASKLTFPQPDSTVETEDKDIAEGLKIRIYHPPKINILDVVGVYTHSGGYITNSIDTEDATCRQIAKAVGLRIISIDYRLAPEYRYPVALNDCYAGAIWAVNHLGKAIEQKQKIIMIGTSAGGGLALGTALKLLDEGLEESLQGVVALAPVTCNPDAVPPEFKSRYVSYDENDNTTINSKSAMFTTFKTYGAPPEDHYTSPLLHKKLKDLPRVYLVCCEKDTLRDDARLVKEVRDSAGASTMYEEYKGYPHMHWIYPSKHLVKAQELFYQNLIKGMQYILS